jgi:hypothetical protein
MAQDEVQNLIIRAQGEIELARINKLLEQQTALFQKILAMQAQNPTNTQYTKGLETTAAKIIAFNKEMQNIERALPTAPGKGSFNTQGMQQLGYALQDFTSASGGFAQKLNSITNNLQMVAASAGMTGPLFLAVTGGMTAFQLLINNWDRLSAWLQSQPSPEEMKARVDALAKRAADFAAVIGAPPPGATAAAGATQEAITAIGGPALASKLEESLTGSAAGWGDAQRAQWRLKNIRNYPQTAAGERQFYADEAVAESASKRDTAKTRVQDLITQAAGSSPAAAGARRELLAIMQANPGRFSKSDIDRIQSIGETSGVGPPKPEDSEANFALQQKALEEREGREFQTAPGITYGGKFPGGAPAPPDAGVAADARAAMQSDRAARAGAMGAGAAGPLIQQPQGRQRRRKYQQTGMYDPAMMDAHSQANAMLNQANMETQMLSAAQMQPGARELQRKINAAIQKQQENMRRLQNMFGGIGSSGTEIPTVY